MKRFLSLPLALLVLTALAWGTDTGPSPSAWEQSSQFRRNRELISEMVDSSLALAREEDPLKRAERCHVMAMQLGDEMLKAANGHDKARVVELRGHYRDVMYHGVAGNLRVADREIPIGSSREADLVQLRDKLLAVSRPLEEDLGKALKADASSSELRGALRAVTDSRKEMESALRLRRPPRGEEE